LNHLAAVCNECDVAKMATFEHKFQLQMNLEVLTSKNKIYEYLGLNPALQIYCIGDLDDFFFPYTTWYGLNDEGELKSLALLYSGMEIPALLLFHEDGNSYGRSCYTF
jgi:hypothetical protein